MQSVINMAGRYMVHPKVYGWKKALVEAAPRGLSDHLISPSKLDQLRL
jgi:hypothetical protein